MKKNNPIHEVTDSADISPACMTATGFADIGKIGRGLNMVFRGYSLVFEALADQAEKLAMPPAQRGEEEAMKAAQEVKTADTPQGRKPDADAAQEKEDVGVTAGMEPPEEAALMHEEAALEAPAGPAVPGKENCTVTSDDISRVITTKLEQCGTAAKRKKFNEGIRDLFSVYLPDLPEKSRRLSALSADKFEAFLNDVAQITV